jgi:hypothetical protein
MRAIFISPLLGEIVGLVPLSNVHIEIVGGVEVVNLRIAVIVIVSRLHRRDDFGKESESLASVVLLEPVGVNIQLVPLPHLILIELVRDVPELPLLLQVTDEIDRPAGECQANRGMIANAERTLHAVLSEDGLDLRRDDSLLALIHVSHCIAFLCLSDDLNIR